MATSIRVASSTSRRVGSGTLLCVGHLRHDIVHLHKVAERASVQIGLEPHFLVTAPERLIDEPRQYLASHQLSEVDSGVEHVAHYWPGAIPRRMNRLGALRRSDLDLARKILHCGTLALPNPILEYRGLRRANLDLARGILDAVQPAAILATVDACHDLFLAEASRRGIPTVYMQVAFWGDQKFYRELWADDERASANGRTRREHLSAGVNKLVQRAFGLHSRPAWQRESSRIAVLGPYWADLLARGGIPPERIAVTGNPHCDEINRVQSGHQGRWRELYQRLGLPGGTRYFLHCREHYGRFNAWSGLDGEDGEREIIEAFKGASPGTPIVVKMHPRDTAEDYEAVHSMDPAVIVVDDVPLIELLAQSLLMVTSISTTQLWSAALDRPTLSAFFWEGLDYWEKATAFSGIERVFTPRELQASVSRNLHDSTYQSVWRQRRLAFAKEMLVVDGRSVERLVQLLTEPCDGHGVRN